MSSRCVRGGLPGHRCSAGSGLAAASPRHPSPLLHVDYCILDDGVAGVMWVNASSMTASLVSALPSMQFLFFRIENGQVDCLLETSGGLLQASTEKMSTDTAVDFAGAHPGWQRREGERSKNFLSSSHEMESLVVVFFLGAALICFCVRDDFFLLDGFLKVLLRSLTVSMTLVVGLYDLW